MCDTVVIISPLSVLTMDLVVGNKRLDWIGLKSMDLHLRFFIPKNLHQAG